MTKKARSGKSGFSWTFSISIEWYGTITASSPASSEAHTIQAHQLLRFPVQLGHAENVRLALEVLHSDQQGPPGEFVADRAGFVE
jgi:hypothetical protein